MENFIYLDIDEDFKVVWENGKVFVQDLDIEAQLCAHALSDTQAHYSIYVLRELHREVSGMSVKAGVEHIYEFSNFTKLSLPQHLEELPDFFLSRQIYVLCKYGRFIEAYNQVFPHDVMVWIIKNYNTNYNTPQLGRYTKILDSWAETPNTPTAILELIAKYTVQTIIGEKIIDNPNVSNLALRYLMIRTIDFFPDYFPGDRLTLRALLKWKGVLDSDIISSVLGCGSSTLINELARHQLKETDQVRLAELSSFTVNNYLLDNPCISPKVRALLQNSLRTQKVWDAAAG